eukprot:gene3386-2340_t
MHICVVLVIYSCVFIRLEAYVAYDNLGWIEVVYEANRECILSRSGSFGCVCEFINVMLDIFFNVIFGRLQGGWFVLVVIYLCVELRTYGFGILECCFVCVTGLLLCLLMLLYTEMERNRLDCECLWCDMGADMISCLQLIVVLIYVGGGTYFVGLFGAAWYLVGLWVFMFDVLVYVYSQYCLLIGHYLVCFYCSSLLIDIYCRRIMLCLLALTSSACILMSACRLQVNCGGMGLLFGGVLRFSVVTKPLQACLMGAARLSDIVFAGSVVNAELWADMVA